MPTLEYGHAYKPGKRVCAPHNSTGKLLYLGQSYENVAGSLFSLALFTTNSHICALEIEPFSWRKG